MQCKSIYYYCILIRHDVKILKLAHMIMCEHDTTSIGNWLRSYRKFVIDSEEEWGFRGTLGRMIIIYKA